MADFFKAEDLFGGALERHGGEKFFAVLGYPAAHSLSPLMQNAALKKIAETDESFACARYVAIETAPEDLARALEFLREKKFSGVNLTIPHKEAAMRIAAEFDSSAKDARACNTLSPIAGGWKAYNTDGFGISAAAKLALGRGFEGADVVLLGAGGAARGAAGAIIKEGCRRLIAANRSAERLAAFARDIRESGFDVETSPLDKIGSLVPNGAIIVNATSVGLKDSDNPVLDFSKIPESCAFLDMPYRRSGETASVLAARERGLAAENGLAMLAWQGAKSLSIWTGKPLLGALMLETLKENLYGHK